MLELALVFQPADSGMEEFDQSEAMYFASQSRTPAIALDCESLSKYDLKNFTEELLRDVTKVTGESLARGEALLEAHSWDLTRLKQAWLKDRPGVCESARLSYLPCQPLTLDDDDSHDQAVDGCGGGPSPAPTPTSGQPVVLGPCTICGEVMLPPLSVSKAIAGRQPNRSYTHSHLTLAFLWLAHSPQPLLTLFLTITKSSHSHILTYPYSYIDLSSHLICHLSFCRCIMCQRLTMLPLLLQPRAPWRLLSSNLTQVFPGLFLCI